jgi:hypothetical protein
MAGLLDSSALKPGLASASLASNTTLTSSTDATATRGTIVFGASGWIGSALSWRLGGTDLPSPEVEQLADGLSSNLEDVG